MLQSNHNVKNQFMFQIKTYISFQTKLITKNKEFASKNIIIFKFNELKSTNFTAYQEYLFLLCFLKGLHDFNCVDLLPTQLACWCETCWYLYFELCKYSDDTTMSIVYNGMFFAKTVNSEISLTISKRSPSQMFDTVVSPLY